MHIAMRAYRELYTSAVSIQTGMRGMVACCELRFRRQTRAATIIQVILFLKKAIIKLSNVHQTPCKVIFAQLGLNYVLFIHLVCATLILCTAEPLPEILSTTSF